MKIMKRLLLIHWHYFVHQMIEFDKINFLTGQNASGKSTIIDAMQVVLLGETSGAFFNKAASGKAERTLKGYLRGELGDDETAGFKYLRNGRFTSYIAMEFYDDVKQRSFTSGCCFDTFGENDTQRLFFRIDDAIPEHEFTKLSEKGNRVPLTLEELRGLIRTGYTGHSYVTTTNRDFHDDLCGKLGGIQPRRFKELLKKAVSFNPNVNIQEFITDFICGEQQEVVIADLLENIRSYDSLNRESEILKERMALLAQINTSYDEYTKNKEDEHLYSFLIDTAALDIENKALTENQAREEALREQKRLLEEGLDAAQGESEQLQAERDSLKLQLDGNEDSRRLAELERQIGEKKAQHLSINDQFDRQWARLHRAVDTWKRAVLSMDEKIKALDISLIDPLFHERIAEIKRDGALILQDTAAIDQPDSTKGDHLAPDEMTALFRKADDYRDRCKALLDRFQDAQLEAAREMRALNEEKAMLEKGKYQFPKDAMDLKDAIESRLRAKYGDAGKAAIVAEAAEIVNDRWRNVIEGYLGAQRFYVIVTPEYFYTAFQLFDSIKRQRAIYNTGLVDTEKMQRISPQMDKGSLAEELTTDNPAVRMFLNFALCRVRKCDSVSELRRYATSITDDGVLYRNFVVRAMNPRQWESPAIGRAGAQLRLQTIVGEIKRLSDVISAYASLATALKDTDGMERRSDADAEQLAAAIRAMEGLPAIEEALQRLRADADAIDRSDIEDLKKRLAERETFLHSLQSEKEQLSRKVGAIEHDIETLISKTIPEQELKLEHLHAAYGVNYSESYIRDSGSPRYERELRQRGGAKEILDAFPREQARARNAKTDRWQETRDLRTTYNNTYKMGHNVSDEGNELYIQLWQDYSANKLPEYEAKIKDTREKAYQQFKEDFLSRLQSNIANVKSQIDDLNAAMRGASFGEDSYRFRVTADPEHKRFHDMIVDRMTTEGGYNLFSEQYENKYSEEIADLFALITNDNSRQTATVSEDYENRVKTFTDYKTYLSFDLEVVKPNGDSERLSKTLGKKSGGETQTPFYIAVLASFVQLYRVGRDRANNTARLIIFDEAFSKMDGERIIQSINLLKRYDFQVLLSAPPDKIHDIATLVDRNLCTIRDGRKTCVLTFDSRQIEEFADEHGL